MNRGMWTRPSAAALGQKRRPGTGPRAEHAQAKSRSSLRRGSCGTRALRALKQSSLPPRLRSSLA